MADSREFVSRKISAIAIIKKTSDLFLGFSEKRYFSEIII